MATSDKAVQIGARPLPLRILIHVLEPLSRSLSAVEWLAMAAAGTCFVAIVLITAVDVALRYLLSRPLTWSYTLISQYLMVAVFFLAIPATQRLAHNIGVDMLVRRLPERLRAALAAVCQALMIVFIGLIASAGWTVFHDAWEGGDILAGAIPWPLWPALVLVPVGSLLLCLRLVADVLGNLAAAWGALEFAGHRRVHARAGFGLGE